MPLRQTTVNVGIKYDFTINLTKKIIQKTSKTENAMSANKAMCHMRKIEK